VLVHQRQNPNLLQLILTDSLPTAAWQCMAGVVHGLDPEAPSHQGDQDDQGGERGWGFSKETWISMISSETNGTFYHENSEIH